MRSDFRLGEWRVRPGLNLIASADQRKTLEPKMMEVLVYLADRHPEVVSKDRLIHAVWAESHVGDEALTSSVYKLRQALGDDPKNPRYIQTVQRRGYRLAMAPSKVEARSSRGQGRQNSPIVGLLVKNKMWAAVGLLLVIGTAVLGIWLGWFEDPPALGREDELLVAEITNLTDDPVFDGTLRTALRVKLEESPYLNVVSNMAVQETLRQMLRPADARITPELGREVCQRRNVKAMMSGQIASWGSRYVLTLRAEDCQTGDSLGGEVSHADSQEEVLDALDRAASAMRHKLGESLVSIRETDTSLTQATTPSLEALKALSQAARLHATWQVEKSRLSLERAIELDPEFAMAHHWLANNHYLTEEHLEAKEYATRAFQLRHRATDLERFGIDEAYYWNVTLEWDKSAESLELETQTYPRKGSWSNLGDVYLTMGRPEKAIPALLKLEELKRDTQVSHELLARSYKRLGRLREAKAVLQSVTADRKLERGFADGNLYELAFIENDKAAMELHWERLRSSTPESDLGEAGISHYGIWKAAYFGRLGESNRLLDEYVQRLEQAEQREFAASIMAAQGCHHALVGNHSAAKQYVDRSLETAESSIWGRQVAAWVLSAIGEVGRAEQLAAEFSREFPRATLWRGLILPGVKANIALQNGQPEIALESLDPALEYELVRFKGVLASTVRYRRGQFLLDLGRGPEAALEFSAILENPGFYTAFQITYPLAHLGLARAKLLSGDETAAREYYRQFLALWKDADPEIPILLKARAEYQGLP